MAQRRRFSAEFKREVVDLTRRPQTSVSQVAQEPGINAKCPESLAAGIGEAGQPAQKRYTGQQVGCT
ncbi:MAG TPA: transposase [Rhodanobacteraceae bacterium]|nr:transposase [Rhodanobacteraceae bacterium]